MKWFLNLYPPYLFTRTRVKHISPDWREVVVVLRKSFLTRNYVGTTFGGSLYAATDPFFMLMLVGILGIKDYIIWDKSSEIYFKKPVRSDVTYHFVITDQDLEKIRKDLEVQNKILPTFTVEGRDAEGDVCTIVKKVLYIRKKSS